MANPNTKFGFKPVRKVSGETYTGAANLYSCPSGDGTAICIGDPVKIVGTGQTINDANYTDVIRAATGDVIVGVCVGSFPDTRDSLIYRAANTTRLIWVVDDPQMLYEIQEASGGTTLTINDLGLNANFVVGAGDTNTGLSGVELDNTTQLGTNTLDIKIVGFANRPDNAVGANAKWLVRINRSLYANQVAGT